jgi:hypothetical protein
LLDQEADVLCGERASVMAEGDVRVGVFHARVDAYADFPVDIHVLGVLN